MDLVRIYGFTGSLWLTWVTQNSTSLTGPNRRGAVMKTKPTQRVIPLSGCLGLQINNLKLHAINGDITLSSCEPDNLSLDINIISG
jgi:hypothetical protein